MAAIQIILLTLGLINGVLSSEQPDKVKMEIPSFQCILCSKSVATSGECRDDPLAESQDIGRVGCSGSCYVKFVTTFGKIVHIDRGCSEKCKPSEGCDNWAGTGMCRRCCTENNCNDYIME
ncbi:uncharacterized protein LOC102804096 [Saccoglossus kowalevskii]|uniref:Uncharacterized protein LOC102804096 n=1 Tax=Saccoglossus kowalevskii TaxID=10224 RepID=A0ABM0MJ30_SACKO|nr:PREDICTED: uncharacterized protein LOC102804096 [Saccoglossus kowalevskii]